MRGRRVHGDCRQLPIRDLGHRVRRDLGDPASQRVEDRVAGRTASPSLASAVEQRVGRGELQQASSVMSSPPARVWASCRILVSARCWATRTAPAVIPRAAPVSSADSPAPTRSTITSAQLLGQLASSDVARLDLAGPDGAVLGRRRRRRPRRGTRRWAAGWRASARCASATLRDATPCTNASNGRLRSR